MTRTRADWRLTDYTGKIRVEVKDMEVRHVAPAFQLLVYLSFGTGAGLSHPQVLVRRRDGTDRTWHKLNEEQKRKFWNHAKKYMEVLAEVNKI